jgi:arylsulfatase A-like enzyme
MVNLGRKASAGLFAALLMTGGCTTRGPDTFTLQAVDGGTSTADAASKSNIIFVLADDLSWNLVENMPLTRLPALQRMMARGTTFSRYFVTDSLCCPSRSSIFTGKYPHDTHVFTNDGPLGGYSTFESHDNQNHTFAVALAGADYKTAMMGKYLNGYQPTTNQADPGWKGWDVAGNGYPEYNYDLNQDGVVHTYGATEQDYLTDVLSGLATKFVTGASNGPFMLEVATFAPHAPYTPPMRYLNTFQAQLPRVPSFNKPNTDPPHWLATHGQISPDVVAKLDGDFDKRVEALKAVDDLIGTLMDQLATTGLDKNTYIFFASDNGYHMGEHQLLAGKQTAFDTDIRVPLIVVGPGVPGNVINDQFVENIDLCPTFAALAGTPAPSTSEGHSLVPLLQGPSVADWRNVVLVEHVGPNGVVPSALSLAPQPITEAPSQLSGVGPDDDYLMAGYATLVRTKPLEPPSYEAIRMTHSVYVEYVTGEKEYYDLTTDPYERHNTASTLSPAQATLFHNTISNIRNCHNAADCWAAQMMP